MAIHKTCWIVFLFCSKSLFPQMVVQGVVSNNGAEPVVNAQVEIISQADSDKRYSCFTNADGHYYLSMTMAARISDHSDKLYKLNADLYRLRASGRDIETHELPDLIIKNDTTLNITVYRILKDIDGNVYRAVKIGKQWWMQENLKVTHYGNGESIDYHTHTGAGSYCDADSNRTALYGRYYNWPACSDNRRLAPRGWHVPSLDEWSRLINALGGWDLAGGKMKESGAEHWLAPNTGATNESGFTALPAGVNDGEFRQRGEFGFFWTTSSGNMPDYAKVLVRLYSLSESISWRNELISSFCSVRCVRDSMPVTARFTITPIFGSTATEFRIDASASADELDEASMLQVRWDWENDGFWDTPYSAAKTITHRYATAGFKDIKLEVKNTYGFSVNTIKRQIWVGTMTNVADARVVPMAIGDKWFYEKRYFYRGQKKPTIDDYTPFVFTVLDTATIQGLKTFLIEQLEIPSYKKARENWYSDSLVFKRNAEVCYDRQILEDTNLGYYNDTWSGIRIKADTIGGIISKTETLYFNHYHGGVGIDRSCTVAEGIGIVGMSSYNSYASEQVWYGTNYELLNAPSLPSGKPLHCFILKMVKMQNALNVVWNKSLEDNISQYRIFVNDKLVDSTASASDTSKILYIPPAAEQSIGIAAVNKDNIMSNYHNQKIADFDKAPSAFNLVSPVDGQIMELSWDSSIAFKWEPAADSDDTLVTYIFHVHGEGLDSMITGLRTTEISLHGRWRQGVAYSWSVQASDGWLLKPSPENTFQVVYTVAVNLLSPANSQTIELPWDSSITFKWESTADSVNSLITYDLHVHGEGLDSTITGLRTTEISLRGRWRQGIVYSWSVQADNGWLLISSPENCFQIAYAAAVNLLSPANSQTIELPWDSSVAFKWESTADSVNSLITYDLHVHGEGLDSTITGLRTTEISLRGRWRQGVVYSWSVQASNGWLLISTPENYFQIAYIAAVNLLAPITGQMIMLSVDSTIAFKWEPSPDRHDQRLSYIFHIQGGTLDSTIAGLNITEISLRGRWQENFIYLWSVAASNGLLSVKSPVNTLQVLYAIFESPRSYPNPFNAGTKIFFRLAAAERVDLTVYNARGQKICTLLDGVQAAGPHIINWSGYDETINRVASGVYFMVFLHQGKKCVQKMLLVK